MPTKITISGVIKTCNQLQQRFASHVNRTKPTPSTSAASLAKEIQSHKQYIDSILDKNSAHPSQLPAPTRQAYYWLAFLTEAQNLHNHLSTLQRAYKHADKICSSEKGHRTPKHKLVEIRLANQCSLYRATHSREQVSITLHEGFINAPESTLASLIYLCLNGKKDPKAEPAKIYSYAQSKDFTTIVAQLNPAVCEQPLSLQTDEIQILHNSFSRVNRTCFDNTLQFPALTWSPQSTRTTFGHYDFTTNTVMISRSLLLPHTPEYVLDFVMYHELLHKKLGIQLKNGRRHAHTQEFREAEKRFPYYQQAQTWLRQLHKTLKNSASQTRRSNKLSNKLF